MESDVIRPLNTSDVKEVSLVFDSWLNSWRTSRYAGVIPNNLYYSTTRSLIEDLITRGAQVLVCDAGPTVKGWVCYEVKNGKTVCHMSYVKDCYLRSGVEEQLMAALPGTSPGFMTFYQPRLAKLGWSHTPEIARRKSL